MTVINFSTLKKLLQKVDDYNKKNIVFGGHFNLIFSFKFDTSGGNPILKKQVVYNGVFWDTLGQTPITIIIETKIKTKYLKKNNLQKLLIFKVLTHN